MLKKIDTLPNYFRFSRVKMVPLFSYRVFFTSVDLERFLRTPSFQCASIFNQCILSDVMKDPIYANHFMMINNIKIQSHLIADSAFGLNATVMKPVSERSNMPKQYSIFNYRLSRTRCSVERAFVSLKCLFRLLHMKLGFKLKNITSMIKAAVILHNLSITNNDKNEIDWDTPTVTYKKPSCNVHTNGGSDVREALVNYFIQNLS